MNEILQQLLAMSPAIGAGLSGQGPQANAFMQGFLRTSALMQENTRRNNQDQLAQQDRAREIERQRTADTRAQSDQEWQETQRRITAANTLGEAGSTAGTATGAEASIDALYRLFTPEMQEQLGPQRDAALRGAASQVSSRQRGEMKRWVNDELKNSAFVKAHPDHDPDVTQAMPARIRQLAESLTGQTTFKKSDLFRLTETLEQAATTTESDFTLSPGQTRFRGGQVVAAVPPNPEKPEKPAKQGFRWLVQGDGEPFEWPDNQPAPRGARPFDQVAARKTPDAAPSAYSVERAQRTIMSVDQLLSKVNRWTTGIGSVLSGIPESDARNFRAELDTLKANIAFNELTAMREASKTGGALGAVSDREMNLLQSALGALDAGQSPENIKAQLGKIKESVQRWQMAHGMAPAISHGPAPRSSAGAKVGDTVRNKQTGELAEVTGIRPDGSLILRPKQ